MSANLRTVAQIPARIKYLVAVTSTSSGSATLTADACRAFTCNEGTFSESLISSASSLPTVSVLNLNAGDLFKDLGRQVTIYDATSNLHLVTYRQVQRISGAGTEGVAGDYSTAVYVRVWAASGAGVVVARTGAGAH